MTTGTTPDHRIERLIFFSDAVIAIAITLLVIEIEIPHLPIGASDAQYGVALLALVPKFVGFVISFLVIGAFWAGHHRVMGCARQWSERLVFPNLLILLAIAATPFFTGFMSANPSARVPVAIYCGWLMITALLNVNLQRLALRSPVVSADCAPAYRAELGRRGIAVTLGTGTALIVALISPLPMIALFALPTIPIWRVLLDRRANRRAIHAAREEELDG